MKVDCFSVSINLKITWNNNAGSDALFEGFHISTRSLHTKSVIFLFLKVTETTYLFLSDYAGMKHEEKNGETPASP